MALDVKQMSWWDTLRLHLLVVVPAALWGLVAPNRLFVSWLARRDASRRSAGFLDALRRKYRCEHLWSWFPWKRTLLVLDPQSMDAVLASEQNAADPPLKKDALSKSIPGALTTSCGDAWLERRRFNEDVLGFGKLHVHHDAFKEIVLREVDRLAAASRSELRWADFQTLAQRIAHQVLLGAGQVEPEMTTRLARMLVRSNWPFLPRDRRSFAAFYERIERHLEGARPNGASTPARCLLHDSARLIGGGRAGASTRVPAQIGFWFFVLEDAIGLHVARTLALIAAHADVQDRVRGEARQAASWTAQAIDGMRDLNACLSEQLRLWTPVPILLRRAVEPFRLRAEIAIASGEQMLIHTGHYHRDANVFGEQAHRFSPDAARTSPPVYFFSRHRQSCAGEFLIRFLLKATLARLLNGCRFELLGPSFEPARIPYSYDHFKIRLRPLADANAPRHEGFR